MLKRVSKALWSLGSGPWCCGVCLFELGLGIRPLEIDIVGRNGAESVFWSSDYHEVLYADMVKSSQRGCQFCKRFIEAFETFHARFVNAQWWPGRSGNVPVWYLNKPNRYSSSVLPQMTTQRLFRPSSHVSAQGGKSLAAVETGRP
jgi:hypothetical protein